MRPPRFAVPLLALLLGLAGAQPLPTLYAALPSEPALEAELLVATNAARHAHGLPDLVQDERLALAARHHADEMTRLGYLSHVSPVPEHASLAQRVAKAGSPLTTLGENLARLFRSDGVAEATIRGWLDSPGHRANLLQPDFTHVGFGLARGPGGMVTVVQVLGRRPARLAYADVQAELRERLELELVVDARAPLLAAFSVGSGGAVTRELAAGEQRVRLVAPAEGPVQVLAGVELRPGAGFVVQDAGWLEPAGGAWTPDPSSGREYLRILAVRPVALQERVALVELQYDGAATRELAVFVDDTYVPDAFLGGGRVELVLPLEPGTVIRIGEVGADRQARIFNALTLDTALGMPRLTAGGG